MESERPKPPRALIVDDHPAITEALGAALLSLHVFQGIDKETSVAAALRRFADGATYDLVLLDLHLTDAAGLDTIVSVREASPSTPVVIFSADESSATITAAFEQGVQGYVPKSAPMSVVVNAIRMVLSGGTYIPPQAVRMLGYEPRPMTNAVTLTSSPMPSLSPRQREVMHYVLQGLPNKVIANRLAMADGTVKTHLNTVYRMFSVNSRAQLILKARDLGLI
jgi:DNA-binding NarL/FixJ family response regulator